jgi:hypothetical protein
MVLTLVIVTPRRFGTAHNQRVSISIALNTAPARALPLTNEKNGDAVPLLLPMKSFK